MRNTKKTISSINRLLQESDELHRAFREEPIVQRSAPLNIQRILNEQKLLNVELDSKKRKFESWCRELDKGPVDECYRLKLGEEKKKRGKAVMGHMGDDDAVHEQIKVMNEQLEEKQEEIDVMQKLNATLITKERQTTDELTAAREELLEILNEMLPSSRAHIGIRRMGDLNPATFEEQCKLKFPDDYVFKSSQLCSLWEERLKNPEWYPFKIVRNGEDTYTKELNEDDSLLRELKLEWGNKIYTAVTTALKEIDEHNPSGNYPVLKLWNFQEDRQATLQEVIAFMCEQFKTLERNI